MTNSSQVPYHQNGKVYLKMIRTLVALALALATAMAQSQNPTTAPKSRSTSTGQAKKSPVAGAGQKAAGSTGVAITIQGLCSGPAHPAAGATAAPPACTTVITKAQF